MSRSLPPRPSLHFLQEEAKDLLKAQRRGDASACPTLRHLHRFAQATDHEILSAHVALHEAQFVLALDYGFTNWTDLRRHLRDVQPSAPSSLDGVRLRSEEVLPGYEAGVPLAIIAALNHAGNPIDYMEFTAATGWAFSFAYNYDDLAPAFLAVQGNPQADGIYEIFGFLPPRLGFSYLSAHTDDHPTLWDFVQKHVDAGIPVVSEHIDGGLLTAYREDEGKRQFYFDATAGTGWIDADKMHPYAVYVLDHTHAGLPPEQLLKESLRHAVQMGAPDNGLGLAALETYYADVANPAKDFSSFRDCWFCWATFERLLSRKCAAVWLDSVAEQVPAEMRTAIRAAATQYHRAYDAYEAYRCEVMAGEPSEKTLLERARTPERIAVIVPILCEGIDAERAGHAALQAAVQML